MRAVLGIDTSCYRTSLALVGEGAILAQRRQLLPVEAGARGLQQSKGVFEHVGQLGVLAQELFAEVPDAAVGAVCVSAKPRPVEGSYMPVFTVGEMLARAIGAACRAPVYYTTHQQGHLRAALYDCPMQADTFLALHLSGGTTEILRADRALNVTLLGGTSDLHAGQFVDRAGVLMGLHFPAGPELEELAARGIAQNAIPTANKRLCVSFSGAEAQVGRMVAAGEAPENVAAEVYSLLARSVAKLIRDALDETKLRDILIAGGVAASPRFKKLLAERLARLRCPVRLWFAREDLSGDNAAGAALIGEEMFQNERRNAAHGDDTQR